MNKVLKKNFIDDMNAFKIGVVIRTDDEYKVFQETFDENFVFENGDRLSKSEFWLGGWTTGLKGVSGQPYNLCLIPSSKGKLMFSKVPCGTGVKSLSNRIKKYLEVDIKIVEFNDIEL